MSGFALQVTELRAANCTGTTPRAPLPGAASAQKLPDGHPAGEARRLDQVLDHRIPGLGEVGAVIATAAKGKDAAVATALGKLAQLTGCPAV
jgi:hypothetical protein